MSNSTSPLLGYPRPDGRWGFRNHILILPLHQALSTAARDIADATPGAVAVAQTPATAAAPQDAATIVIQVPVAAPVVAAAPVAAAPAPAPAPVVTVAPKTSSSK